MKPLNEYRKDYYQLSGAASSSARQLSFAGIAVVWVFRVTGPDGNGQFVPPELYWPTIWFVVSLAADLLQYAVAAAIWSAWSRLREKEYADSEDKNPELMAPAWFNWLGLGFYYGKLGAVLTGYYLLGDFLIGEVL